jgi:hypothetical protein
MRLYCRLCQYRRIIKSNQKKGSANYSDPGRWPWTALFVVGDLDRGMVEYERSVRDVARTYIDFGDITGIVVRPD